MYSKTPQKPAKSQQVNLLCQAYELPRGKRERERGVAMQTREKEGESTMHATANVMFR